MVKQVKTVKGELKMMNQNYTTMSNSKIPACKKSFQYGLFALKVGDKLNAAKRYDQASQYVRSSTSIGANLSEANAASSDRNFIPTYRDSS